MTFTGLLNRTVQVWRGTTSDTDEGGYPVEAWSLLTPDIPARITPVGDREGVAVDGTGAIIEAFAIVTPMTDLTERDRIVDDATGVYRVDQVHQQDGATGPHHLEIVATKLTG